MTARNYKPHKLNVKKKLIALFLVWIGGRGSRGVADHYAKVMSFIWTNCSILLSIYNSSFSIWICTTNGKGLKLDGSQVVHKLSHAMIETLYFFNEADPLLDLSNPWHVHEEGWNSHWSDCLANSNNFLIHFTITCNNSYFIDFCRSTHFNTQAVSSL